MFFTISSCLIAFIAFALLLHLAIFHVYINHVGITTYEYVRAHRLLAENNPPSANSESEDQATNSSNCCQMFKSKVKVAPASTTEKPNESSKKNDMPNLRNGGKSTVEKLPPIFPPSPPKPAAKQVKVEEVKGSAVPKLPKLVEDNNGSAGSALVDHNRSSRPHLARVQKHLESIDVEDQDKIYVVEVS